LTTEQIIILGFLALAFLAGWVARALVGGVRQGRGREPALVASEPEPAPVVASGPEPIPAAQSFEVAVHQSRDELGRAIRAYHSAVVRTLRNGSGRDSGQESLEALSGALVALSRAVDHESRALDAEHPLTARLQRTGMELRRLADDVMRHSRERELPAGVFDQLEQHLISAASMILTPSRLQAEAA
jgi:hypothetical protein